MKTPLDTAREFLQRGWMPLPVPFKSKNPNFPGWQHFSVTEGELSTRFNGQPQNVGVRLGVSSKDLVDIDLDASEAVSLAPYLLKTTQAVFGRDSKRRSHWLYYAKIAIRKYTDPILEARNGDKAGGASMLLEIRSTGAQTLFPGSVHPSGEPVTWDSEGEPALIEATDLLRTVARVAAASLLSRYWPNGARNEREHSNSGPYPRASLRRG